MFSQQIGHSTCGRPCRPCSCSHAKYAAPATSTTSRPPPKGSPGTLGIRRSMAVHLPSIRRCDRAIALQPAPLQCDTTLMAVLPRAEGDRSFAAIGVTPTLGGCPVAGLVPPHAADSPVMGPVAGELYGRIPASPEATSGGVLAGLRWRCWVGAAGRRAGWGSGCPSPWLVAAPRLWAAACKLRPFSGGMAHTVPGMEGEPSMGRSIRLLLAGAAMACAIASTALTISLAAPAGASAPAAHRPPPASCCSTTSQNRGDPGPYPADRAGFGELQRCLQPARLADARGTQQPGAAALGTAMAVGLAPRDQCRVTQSAVTAATTSARLAKPIGGPGSSKMAERSTAAPLSGMADGRRQRAQISLI